MQTVNPPQIDHVYSLPPLCGVGSSDTSVSFVALGLQAGHLWAMGSNALLESVDGRHWHDAAANLRDDGDFYVSTVAAGPAGVSAVMRNRRGLACYHRRPPEANWHPLFAIPSRAAGAQVAWTKLGWVGLSEYAPDTEVIRASVSPGAIACQCGTLPGAIVHFQMDESGNGAALVRHVAVTADSVVSGPSSLFVTGEHGLTWCEVARTDARLLAAASTSPRHVLAGGVDGAIVAMSQDGVQTLWQETGGDVVAIGLSAAHQVAVIESDEMNPAHRLLRLDRQEWIHHEIHLRERVRGIRFLSDNEFVVCTTRSLFHGRFQ